MKSTNKNIEDIKAKIVDVLKKHGVVRAGIFGSYARGEQEKGSDIDILIEYKESLLKLVGLEMELEEKLGIKADLLTYKGVHPLLKNRIFKEEVRII